MSKQEMLKLPIGTWVFCTVWAVSGWYRVTAIRPRDGYIRISNGSRAWCPPHNFSLTDRQGQSWHRIPD